MFLLKSFLATRTAQHTQTHTHTHTFVLHDVAESAQVPLDEGDPHQPGTSAAAPAPARAGLYEASQREADLPPSPRGDASAAESEDRRTGLFAPPGRRHSPRNSANAALSDVGEHERCLHPSCLIRLAASPVTEPFPHPAGERGVERGEVHHVEFVVVAVRKPQQNSSSRTLCCCCIASMYTCICSLLGVTKCVCCCIHSSTTCTLFSSCTCGLLFVS